MDRFAFLVGNDTYSDAKFPPLKAPRNDARRLAAILRQKRSGGYKVETLCNEPEKTIRYQIEKFLTSRAPTDIVLLYWSGHGFRNKSGALCLAATDSEYDAARSTSVDARFLRDCLSECRSRQKIVIIDACHSGAFLTGAKSAGDATSAVRAELKEARGTFVLTSGSATQESWEEPARSDDLPVLSVFTRYLVEGLETGRADRIGDGEITALALYEYIDDRMSGGPDSQRPMYGAEDGAQGRIVVAYTGRRPHQRTAVSNAATPMRPFHPPLRGFVKALRDGWKSGRRVWERWPTWARIMAAMVLTPVTLVFGIAGALAVGIYALVYVGLAIWDRDPRLLYGTVVACTVVAVVIGAVAARVVTRPPSPRQTCDYAWAADAFAEPASVPIATGKEAYTAVIRTTLGDITIKALSSSYPCAALAFRYLAEDGFYTNVHCSYFDQPTSGYILDCFDPSEAYPDIGVSFSPDDTSVPDPSDGLILLNISGNESQGLLAFSGNDPAVAAGSYEPCAQITQGLDIIRKVANAGLKGGLYSLDQTAQEPITIKSVTITVAP